MKKFVLILGLFLSICTNACADDITFLHPIFYQQLSSQNGDFFYVLKPNSIYYEDSEIGLTQTSECILQKNQVYSIQMLCNDCNSSRCFSRSSRIHTFALSKNKTTDNNYIISHKVYNENNSLESKEILINDGLITIPPYQ